MKVLVTGASGFAGSHFLDHVFRETNDDAVVIGSFRHRGKTDRITEILIAHDAVPEDELATEDLWTNRVTVLTHDLTTPVSNQMLEKIGDIDWMVCYASESHVTRSINDPVPFIENNVKVALQSMELARVLKPKGVIWISTDEVCGPLTEGQEPHPEWSLQLPSNPYSASKASQEAICFAYWRTYGVPVVIVRCMNMFGERQDPEKFIPLIMAKVAAGDEVTVHTDAEGNSSTRNYLHARNLASGIQYVMDCLTPAEYGVVPKWGPWAGRNADRPDMYNVVAGAVISNLKLAETIADMMGQELRYRLEDASLSRPGHDPHYGLSPSKLFDLGWRPPVDFEESLERTVRWTMNNKRWLLS